MYDYIIAASGLHATPDKTQVYCENSVAHFDWLVANGVHYAQKFSNEKEISIPDGSLYFSGSERVWPFRDTIKPRSEEHTSELQSLMRNSYAVYCLQKKKH